jgi:putative spermidine/putrescine transport system permease protein
MWEQIRFDIDPTLASVSTLLITATTCLMISAELFRRRSERLRTAPIVE